MWGFLKTFSISCYPLRVFDLFGLLCFIVFFCQSPPTPCFLFLFIYITLLLSSSCFFHHHLISCFIFPHMVSPLSSPLLSSPLHSLPPATHPPLSLRLPSVTVSQRHSQTGGGVKRRWAPGNPRGAFQWQGPQVKISRAEPWCCSNRREESKGEEQAVSTGPYTHLERS